MREFPCPNFNRLFNLKYRNMEARKKSNVDLSKKRNMYLSLGLLVSLVIVVSAFEWKTIESGSTVVVCDFPEPPILPDIPTTEWDPPKPPKVALKIIEVTNEKEIKEVIDVTFDQNEMSDIKVEIPDSAPDLPDETAPDFFEIVEN